MTQEQLKEAKNFRRQMKWCAILCWVATLAFIFIPHKNPNAGYDWVIVPCGGMVMTLIYISMNSHIKEYEKQNKNEL
jgi:hypothetical protein